MKIHDAKIIMQSYFFTESIATFYDEDSMFRDAINTLAGDINVRKLKCMKVGEFMRLIEGNRVPCVTSS